MSANNKKNGRSIISSKIFDEIDKDKLNKNRTPIIIRNKTKIFFTTPNMKEKKESIFNDNKEIKIKNDIHKFIEENKTKTKSNNRLKDINFGKVPRNFLYKIKLVEFCSYKYNKLRMRLPTPELTDSIFDKKYELSKIISKIKENNKRKKRIKNEINDYKIYHDRLKMNRIKNLLKNDDGIFNYLYKDHSSCDVKKNKINNINSNSNSKKKLEEFKSSISNKKSRNYLGINSKENPTIEKLLKMKEELNTIKFVDNKKKRIFITLDK
jgi:hypothetical protein